MKKDSIGRRDRFTRTPDPDANPRVTLNDLLLGAYNQKRGGVGLVSWMLERAKTHTPGYLKKRLTILRQDMALFDILPFQRRTDYPHRNALINTNSDKFDKLLKQNGMFTKNVPEASGAHYHDTFQGFAYESSIATLPDGYHLEMQHEVLEGKSSCAITIDGVTAKPDITTRLTTPKRTILIFDEIDRASEPNRREESIGKSWEPRIKFYQKLIGEKLYKDIYPCEAEQYAAILRIWTVDTSNMMAVLKLSEKLWGKPCRFIMAQTHTEFGYAFHPPKGYIDVYNTPWFTAGDAPYIFTEAK